MKQRILAIDGNYFFHRALGQLNMGDEINNLETEEEQNKFWANLNQGIVTLYQTFNNDKHQLINNIVFVVDNGSWRKEVEPHRPYYIHETELTPIKYKEQRRTTREKSTINYDNFDIIINKFTNHLKDKLNVLDVRGLEGDDNLMLISEKLGNSNTNIEIIVFCTDGDLVQIVKNNVFLFRNIRSKNCPNGEFVITNQKYTELFDSKVSAFLKDNSSEIEYKKLFNIMLGDTTGNNKIVRSLNTGISVATPFRTALVKSVCGDKKDNLFSILSWKSKTGTINYKITEKYLTKALAIHGLYLTENTCKNILTDKESIYNLLLALKEVTKQTDVDVNVMAQHLKHNLKLNVLSKHNVPEQYLLDWDIEWSKIYIDLMKNFDENRLKLFQQNKYIKDNAIDVFDNSIPDELKNI